jgi:hypothetical protein
MAAVARWCDGEHSCEQIVIQFARLFALSVDHAAREVYRALAILRSKQLISPI